MKNFRYTIPKTPITVRVERTFSSHVHCIRSCRAYRAMGIVMIPSTRKLKRTGPDPRNKVKQVFLNFLVPFETDSSVFRYKSYFRKV